MDDKGFAPFDLEVPAQLVYPALQPFAAPLPGTPETHAQRMARTDRQLERERRERAMLDALETAESDWREQRAKAERQLETVAFAVLGLHAPVLDNGTAITCNECCACDYYGEGTVEWPCGTFRVVKELL